MKICACKFFFSLPSSYSFRPAIWTISTLEAAISLCSSVELLAGAGQAVVGAIASVLPPLLQRTRSPAPLHIATIEEALLVNANLTWLPATILV